MFDGAEVTFGAEPNTQVTPVSLGLPGALPAVNAVAVEYAIRIGLALNCSIAERCRFARKNYFYPDVPKNFQTSQYDEPIAFEGWVDVELDDGRSSGSRSSARTWRRTPARTRTSAAPTGASTAPSTRWSTTTAPASRWWRSSPSRSTARASAPRGRARLRAELRDIFRALGVSEARMERGNVRCDVNVSIRPTPGVAARHPHRDQERQLVPVGRAGRPLRGQPPGGRARRRRHDHPGDPPLARGHRDHHRPAA